MQKTYTHRILMLIIPALILYPFLPGCDQPEPESRPVATVNGRIVTADEFAFFYEFIPRHIAAQTKEKAYTDALQRLTDRILLAQKAESMGLEASDTLMQRALDLFRRQAVNRELYLKYIRNPITVTEQEARKAFERSCKTLHVKHFQTALEPEIKNVRSGVMPWKHIPMYPGVKTIESPLYGAVDAISWNDVAPDLEEKLYSMDLHQVSEPVFDGTYYHIFKVVDYEKNVLIREHDFQAHRESMTGVLRKRKETRASSEFVQQVMAPQQVIIKADVLNALTRHLWEKRPLEPEKLQYLPDQEVNTLEDTNRRLAARVIATYRDGELTVGDLIMNYRVNPQPVTYTSEAGLRESLKNAAAVYVRDHVLSEMGLREKMDQYPSVREEVQTRREYLLAEKMIRNLYHSIKDSITSDEEKEVWLEDYLTKLRADASIEIDEDLLLSINTSDEGFTRKIDFVGVSTSYE
jgi:hypothetical protein